MLQKELSDGIGMIVVAIGKMELSKEDEDKFIDGLKDAIKMALAVYKRIKP